MTRPTIERPSSPSRDSRMWFGRKNSVAGPFGLVLGVDGDDPVVEADVALGRSRPATGSSRR